jgi:hypothetical protein
MNHGSNKAIFYLFTLDLFKDLDNSLYYKTYNVE